MKTKELKELVKTYKYEVCTNIYGITDDCYCDGKTCNTCWELSIKQEINRKIKVLTDLLESIENSNNEEEM